jgi:hypothetical protein
MMMVAALKVGTGTIEGTIWLWVAPDPQVASLHVHGCEPPGAAGGQKGVYMDIKIESSI